MRPTDLHEEAGDQHLADVGVVVSAGEVGAPARQVEAVHDPGQLLAHVVGRHQRAVVHKVVVAPLGGVVVCGDEVPLDFRTRSPGGGSDRWVRGHLLCLKAW